MFATQKSMISAFPAVRTAPAMFAGYRQVIEKLKPRQWLTWQLGDTSARGTMFRIASERLGEAVDLQTGERVLNVTAGNSATSLADTEHLPFRDAAFDVVLSGFAAMFAPDHYRIAAELLRVCRKGGRIGLACWTPESFNGQLMKILDRYSTRQPAAANPVLWGTRKYLNHLFGNAADALGASTRTHTWRYNSPDDWLKSWNSRGGPLFGAYRSIDPEWRDQFSSELLALVDRFNDADDGSMIVQSEYLEFVIHKSTWRV